MGAERGFKPRIVRLQSCRHPGLGDEDRSLPLPILEPQVYDILEASPHGGQRLAANEDDFLSTRSSCKKSLSEAAHGLVWSLSASAVECCVQGQRAQRGVALPPSLLFRYLQSRPRVQLRLSERANVETEGPGHWF